MLSFAAGWGSAWMQWTCLAVASMLGASAWKMRRDLRLERAERWRERRMREELEAYARVDPAAAPAAGSGVSAVEAGRALAKRVCLAVAEKSSFDRVAMLLRDADGRFYCAGSVGVDDLTVQAMEAWGARVVEDERGLARTTGQAKAMAGGGAASFPIPLGEWHAFDREVGRRELEGKKERRRWRRGIVAPVRMSGGKMMGAIVVCADAAKQGWPAGLERAMGPVETLTARIAAAIENEVLTQRVLRAEKLAGLGQLAGGVAHALNNPLTAVLGFAELISETATEPRVRKDAATIALEATKMKDTVERLSDFWRPPAPADDPVDVKTMLEELAAACTGKLEERGVKLTLTLESGIPPVHGSGDRLRQVFEHLLNNAAQAIAAAEDEGRSEERHEIRITASHDERMLHIIVSDTGTGFTEPGKVFDPFSTASEPKGDGLGLGLSICYGIVREHGGEISAFNLHPRGAAVVLELPVKKAVRNESGERLMEKLGVRG